MDMELCSIFCNNENGKRIDTCICITELSCWTPETNTTLLINYTWYKNLKNQTNNGYHDHKVGASPHQPWGESANFFTCNKVNYIWLDEKLNPIGNFGETVQPSRLRVFLHKFPSVSGWKLLGRGLLMSPSSQTISLTATGNPWAKKCRCQPPEVSEIVRAKGYRWGSGSVQYTEVSLRTKGEENFYLIELPLCCWTADSSGYCWWLGGPELLWRLKEMV